MLALLLALGGLAGASLSFYAGAGWLAFVLRADQASAVVERVEVRSIRGRGSTYTPWFRFTDDDGRSVLARSHNVDSWPRYAVPQAVRVRYDRTDPAWAEADALPTLLFGPLLLLVFSTLVLAIAWVFFRPLGNGRSDAEASRIHVTATRHAWGTVTTRRSGLLPPLRRPLKLLIAGSGYAFVSMLALTFLRGELTAALARREVSVDVVGRIEPKVKERQLIRGELVPVHVPVIRFTTADGREQVVDATPHPELRTLSFGDPVRLRYPRADPAAAVPASVWREWRRVVVAGAAALAVLGAGGFLLWRFGLRTGSA